MAFTFIIQYTKLIVDLKLLIIGTKVTTVLCVRRKKYGLELLRTETGSNMYVQASLREKAKHWNINIVIL